MKTKLLPIWIILIALSGAVLILISSCKKDEIYELPKISTTSVTEVTANTAKSGGNITDDGGGDITSRGVIWSTKNNPTTDNNEGITSDGTGLGEFTSNLSGLSPGTIYYVRAYASNIEGTTYGNEREFTTLDGDDEGDWPRDTQTQVVEVTNPATGKTWMDRNLGASRAATSSTDAQAYGDLYQWGRAADGHQVRTSGTTSTLSSSNNPGHGNFILAPNSPYDWRSPQNTNLWQGVNGTNNPCPAGYRLPTAAELEAERVSWGSNNAAGAFGSPLKLPVAGGRYYSSGSLGYVGSGGYYWSSSVTRENARRLLFRSGSAVINRYNRAHGLSVRCIKD